MSRASAVYFSMFLLLVVGLWGILRAGASLRAPADLSGDWKLRGVDGFEAPGEMLSIEQSGKYVRLRIDGGPTLDLKLDAQTASGGGADDRSAGRDRTMAISLIGEDAELTADGAINAGTARMRLRRANRPAVAFDARRVGSRLNPAPGHPATAPTVAPPAPVVPSPGPTHAP